MKNGARQAGERAGSNHVPLRVGGADPPDQDFLLWQLADSAFPTGGFAHSGGLEAAWQHGEVRNRAELVSYLDAALAQAGRNALPFVREAHQQPDQLAALDRHCDAFTNNHVANRASRLQGRAFFAALEKIFPAAIRQETPPPFKHLAPIFGAGLRRLEVKGDTTLRLFLFCHLRGLLAAAVRLNIVGPMEAQSLQLHLSERARRLCDRPTALEDLAQTSPLLEIWQAGQDRLYSRLFQS